MKVLKKKDFLFPVIIVVIFCVLLMLKEYKISSRAHSYIQEYNDAVSKYDYVKEELQNISLEIVNYNEEVNVYNNKNLEFTNYKNEINSEIKNKIDNLEKSIEFYKKEIEQLKSKL